MILAMSFAAAFALNSGDRVVFYGDSITEQRLYTTYVEAFVTTRYPGLDVHFFNRGWSGDASWGGGGGLPSDRARLDVAPLKPTQICVMLGMNDGGYVPYDSKIEEAIKEWYPKVLDALSATSPRARLTLIRTSPWDDFAHSYASVGKPPEPWAPWKGYNDSLQRYGLIAKNEAEKRGGQFVDFNQPLCDVLTKAAQKDPSSAERIIPDSIHPGPGGHLIMAGCLLDAWHANPTVSAVVINAKTQVVISSHQAKVSNLKNLSWSQIDNCLPFVADPNDPVLHLAGSVGMFDELRNREMLTIQGLEEGTYQLSIDRHVVATLSSFELAGGVNLAAFDTPIRQQAHTVLDLVRKRAEIQFTAWRTIQRESSDAKSSKAAYDTLEKLAEELHQQSRAAAIPKPRQFSLKRV
ncbi:MAG: SGNH/GDSL hydrolase family protein [Armatimonadota bacterium]